MNSNRVKLSIIIPVYNVEPYLRKCVDSVLHQDLSSSEYEVILVNDGSTDNSGVICDEYASSSFINSLNRSVVIKVIHQKNAGLSAARNAGIAAARGEYLCFVDSDDYWEPNVLGGLMAQVERENLDVLRFDYQNVRIEAYPQQCSTDGHRQSDRAELFTREGKGEDTSKMISGEYEVFEPNKTPRYIDRKNEIVDGEMYLNTRMGYACYAWQFIIKRGLIIDGVQCKVYGRDCLFTEGIHFEDVDWLPRMMLRAKRVNSTTTIVYNYLVRQGSITKTQGDKIKIRKNIEDSLFIIDRYKQYREQHQDCLWLYNMQSVMVSGVLTNIARTFYVERNEYEARLKEMKAFPLSIADQGKTYKRRAVLINLLGVNLYCMLMHYL